MVQKILAKTHIRKNDKVQLMSGSGSGTINGEDRGARGKILSIDRLKGKAVVQGLRMVFRHRRRNRNAAQPEPGRIEREAPIALASLMLVCPNCDQATRIAIETREAEREGRKKVKRVRVCKRCGADIPDVK